jgi:ATP-binding cassette, subfamily C (CFTR/MRP), member 1
MVDSGEEKERDYSGATEPVGGVENTNNDEPLDVDGKEKEYLEIKTSGDPSSRSSHSGSELGQDEKRIRPKLEQTKSYATTTSAVTTVPEPAKKKPWYRKINPLRWSAAPPVPTTRGVSREYSASFLSLVYFQWMAPIMSVSSPHFGNTSNTDGRRLDINDS